MSGAKDGTVRTWRMLPAADEAKRKELTKKARKVVEKTKNALAFSGIFRPKISAAGSNAKPPAKPDVFNGRATSCAACGASNRGTSVICVKCGELLERVSGKSDVAEL
eukprot:SAG31_NODE_455_length_15433_cov_4.248728_7_plen_108_part_00